MKAQERKMKFILTLSGKYDNIPILVGGDIGHRPVWGDSLILWALGVLGEPLFDRGEIIITAGQHDLLNHRLENCYKKALGILWKEGIIEIHERGLLKEGIGLFTYPYSTKIEKVNTSDINIALAHQMVIKSQSDKLWEAQEANHAKRLLRKFPCYNLIVTGDNHQAFVVEHDGRLLVNPGSIMRMSANQIDFKPRVYLWYAETNEVEAVYLPIEKDVFDTSHLTENKERDTRIESFVNRLSNDYEIGMDYEGNLKKFFNKNKQERQVEEKVWGSLNEKV
jgi:predicted phosphodiesterase